MTEFFSLIASAIAAGIDAITAGKSKEEALREMAAQALTLANAEALADARAREKFEAFEP